MARPWPLLLLLFLELALTASAAEPTAADKDFFEREIRPLLVQHCHACHGELPEPKGGLSLTSREAVLKGGESGPAAVPWQPRESRLIAAVNYDGLEMPPEGKKLSPVDIARLTHWVERGLPWGDHDPAVLRRAKAAVEDQQIAEARRTFWSFQPVARSPLPAVRNANWPQTSIDHFILAGLEARGLAPSRPADKRTLLRRLTFDLIGLPPTPEELGHFLADDASDAIPRVVERLLASPHYGERWGRHWLDVARYADTRGYVLFQDGNFPWSYTYRDYVVRSLNEDVPYDRFVVEQLAADRLPLGRDKRALTALGFLTLGNGFMNNQQDVVDDRIDVVTRGLLGLTVSCARCHDHKFDPVPTADYYSLYGVLASSVEPTIPPLFEDPPATPEYAAFAKELDERERKLREFLELKLADLVSRARSRVSEYLLAAQALDSRPAIEDFMLLADDSDLNPAMIVRYQAYLNRSRQGHDPVLAIWHALAALPTERFAAEAPAVIERLIAAPSAVRPVNPLLAGAFLGKPLKELADAARIYGELLIGADKLWQVALAQAKQAAAPPPVALTDANLEAVRQVLYGPATPASVTLDQIDVLGLLPDRPAQMERTKLLKAIEDWRASGPAAPPRAMVLDDLKTPIEPHVFLRGNPNQLGDAVPRRFLRVLSSGEPAPLVHGSGRLDLARAIVDPANPLTARVLVNRVWLEHFGSALVSTPSDFGLRSRPPTHPELLDHLAAAFVDGGWSLKALHRQIVLSAAYQQASDEKPECRAIDPQNELLWKANRRRLDFEATRDALLAVAGRLEPQFGGKPIKDIGAAKSTRRTIYGSVDRLNLPGLFRTFDFPSPDATSPERSQTTVPQQALFFLNGALVTAAAEYLVARPDVLAEADDDRRIARLYHLALSREPTAEELKLSEEIIRSASQAAVAWRELAQGLLSTNEFVFVD